MKRFSLDTETTGIDMYHGARPFFVTVCNEDGPRFWEWLVNPINRMPMIPRSHVQEISKLTTNAEQLILQNSKFDARALNSIGVPMWDWAKVDDTLIAGHVLYSNKPHNLTDMALQYLNFNIKPYEDDLEKAVKEAQRYCRSKLKDWRLAKAGHNDMPSAKEKTWKFDTWLPRTLVQFLWEESSCYQRLREMRVDERTHRFTEKQLRTISLVPGWEYHPPEIKAEGAHPWWTVLQAYANADSIATWYLWQQQWKYLQARKYEKIYRVQMELVPILYEMEERGLTLSEEKLTNLQDQYHCESYDCATTCMRIAKERNFELTLPKSGLNHSLRDFVFDVLKLPVVARTDSGAPSLDKAALEQYINQLDNGPELEFVTALRDKRSRDTAITYLESYKRFWLPITHHIGWYVLHPSLNPTGTDTLRFSSNNPNEQNISKKKGFNLRSCFGPPPGYEWWSMDYENIELRIPAYDSGQQEMIDLFERPNDPPYYGSQHLLVAHILHPELFEECLKRGVSFKDEYKSTWYQWVKNGNFAVQYGAQESSGTADRAYHVPGAQRRIQARFYKIAELNKRMIAHANHYGYVETMPDKTVDPERGYPLLCTRTESGSILPTVPLSYRVQGTAMWCTRKAKIRCHEQIRSWRANGFDCYIPIQVHDEMVFCMPKGGRKNLPKVRRLQQLMEQSGDDIGVPLRVSVSYHPDNWADEDDGWKR